MVTGRYNLNISHYASHCQALLLLHAKALLDKPCNVASPWRRDLEFKFANSRTNLDLNPEDAHKAPHTPRPAWSSLRHGTVGHNGFIWPRTTRWLVCLAADMASRDGADADQLVSVHSCLSICMRSIRMKRKKSDYVVHKGRAPYAVNSLHHLRVTFIA